MSFTTPLYGLFLIFILFFFLGICFLFPVNRSKFFRFYFLIASYLFYASWDYFSLLLIIITSLTDFFVSRIIFRTSSISKKRLFLIFSLIINLGVLFSFKYYAFFVKNLSYSLNIFNLKAEWLPTLNLLLPVGISFYTFQSLSYTLDVFRGEIFPETDIVKYFLYVSFFPQLVAGPIVPARVLLPQLENFFISEENFIKGLGLIAFGLFKKVLIADRLAFLVDIFYENPSAYSWASTIIALLSYSVQIYCDFSGYTDIARGSAFLFGIALPENFHAPYLSLSFTEFWRRWHITLSNWLKNYLYISLGGNRKGKFRNYINLLLTMLLGGLWHGANWNFLLWGSFHGALLVIEKSLFGIFSFDPVVSTGVKFKKSQFLGIFSRWLFVFGGVTLLWIPFRAPDLKTTILVLKKIFIYSKGMDYPKALENEFFSLFLLVIVSHFAYLKGFELETYVQKIPKVLIVFLFVVFLHFIILFTRDSKPFIYFVF